MTASHLAALRSRAAELTGTSPHRNADAMRRGIKTEHQKHARPRERPQATLVPWKSAVGLFWGSWGLLLSRPGWAFHGRSKSLFRVAIGEPARGPPPGSERTPLRGNLDAACGPHHALTPAKTERRADPPWRMPLVPALRVRDLISACAGRSVLDTRKRASQDLPWAAGRQGHVHSPTAVRREFRLGHTNACAQNGRGAGLPTPGN